MSITAATRCCVEQVAAPAPSSVIRRGWYDSVSSWMKLGDELRLRPVLLDDQRDRLRRHRDRQHLDEDEHPERRDDRGGDRPRRPPPDRQVEPRHRPDRLHRAPPGARAPPPRRAGATTAQRQSTSRFCSDGLGRDVEAVEAPLRAARSPSRRARRGRPSRASRRRSAAARARRSRRRTAARARRRARPPGSVRRNSAPTQAPRLVKMTTQIASAPSAPSGCTGATP